MSVRVTMILVAACAFAVAGRAEPDITATVNVVSDYLFRGQRLAGSSIAPVLELANGDSRIGVSGNRAFRRAANPGRSEIDAFASHRFPLSRETGLRPGMTVYYYAEPPATYRQLVAEPSVAFDYTIASIRLTPTCYYDLSRKGATFELAAAIALPLAHLGTEIDLAATIGTYRLNDAFTGVTSNARLTGDYVSFDVSIPVQVSTAARVTVGLSYGAGANSYIKEGALPQRRNPLAVHRGVFWIGYSRVFKR